MCFVYSWLRWVLLAAWAFLWLRLSGLLSNGAWRLPIVVASLVTQLGP